MGGTIDAALYPEEDHLYPAKATMTDHDHVGNMVEEICKGAYAVETIRICKKDSNDIDDTDRTNLVGAIRNADGFGRMIVTMGTDRMRETALDLISRNPALLCPVVFTGAIWPLANGEKSDGRRNLEQAIFTNPDLKSGIYIAMGDVFAPASLVHKDFENKKFVIKVDAKAL